MVFPQNERDSFYRLVAARRDIRQFSADPVPTDTLRRILAAAHLAPSVGFMQPWNFILIRSRALRAEIKASFDETNANELGKLTDQAKRELYRAMKLEGILEAPLNLAVTCDRRRDAPFVLGRAPMVDTDLFSTCLAIQNLWLAARAEGVGIGWVSILDHAVVERLLEIPVGVRLVAYLCVGYPLEFRERPMLEEKGWKARLPLASLVHSDCWGAPADFSP